jgi:uncharacterized membrane protein
LFKNAGTFCSLFLWFVLGFITILVEVKGLDSELGVDCAAGLGAIVLNKGAIEAGI